jgi:hypothetical protein
MRYALSAIVIAGAFVLGADTPDAPHVPIRSAAAIAAIHKADAAQKSAQETYDQEMFKVKRTELEGLRFALKAATQKGDLDEANSINAKVQLTEDELAKPWTPQAKASAMQGRWKVFYDGGQEDSWIFTANKVTHLSNNESVTPVIQGNVMVLKWPDGYIDRLTFEGDKVFKETWKPGRSMNSWPDNVWVGFRDTGK